MFEQFSLDLVGMLAGNSSLSSIVQYAGRMFENPLMVTDETFCVLAYTQDQQVPDPIWKEIIENRYSSSRLVQQTDLAQGTHYVETLRSYFRNNQNVSSTAAELYLHRNTVNYRLVRIRELLGDDFDDFRIRLHLEMALIWHDFVQMNKEGR